MGLSGLGQRDVNVKQRACHAKIRGAWCPTKFIVTRHIVLHWLNWMLMQVRGLVGVERIGAKGSICYAENSRTEVPTSAT